MYLRLADRKIGWRFVGVALVFVAGYIPVANPELSAAQAAKPNGWITIKDKTGSCQMSVPADWVPNSKVSGHVITPEQTDSMIISGFKHPRKPMSAETQKAVGVDKMFENTGNRWFYALKPIRGTGGKPTLVVYHVEIEGDDRTCIAQILVKQDHSEEQVKKIALSVSGTK